MGVCFAAHPLYHDRRMNSICYKFMFAICLVLTLAHWGSAQESIRIRLKAPENDGQQALDDHFDSFRSQINERLAELAGDVQSVCDLDNQQLKEVTDNIIVAAETIIAAHEKTVTVNIGTYRMRIGFVLDKAGNVIPGKTEERKRNYTYFTLRTLPEASIVNSEPVAKAILDSLSEQQKPKWEVAAETRKNFLRTSAVDLFVARVDIALLLSDEQRTQLREAILGHELADALADDLRFYELNRNRHKIRTGPRPNKKYTSLVINIFDDGQLSEWKRIFEFELARLQNPARGAVRLR